MIVYYDREKARRINKTLLCCNSQKKESTTSHFLQTGKEDRLRWQHYLHSCTQTHAYFDSRDQWVTFYDFVHLCGEFRVFLRRALEAMKREIKLNFKKSRENI